MALRKAKCYSKAKEVPYTRKSKKKTKNFIKAPPVSKVVKFTMGNKKRFENNQFKYVIDLVTNERVQMRDNSIEACRLNINRHLEKELGRQNFYFQIRVYPHHILRENKMLTGAGADRMQTGMKQSFGKTVGVAAQIKKGQAIFTVALDVSQKIIKLFKANKSKIPCRTSIVIKENKNYKPISHDEDEE